MMRKKKQKKKKNFQLFFSILIAGLFTITVGGVVYFFFLMKNLPSPERFEERRVSQSTKIFDREETQILYEIHGEEKRTVVPFSEIPESVKKATLTAENVDFYNEPAFNWRGIARAFVVNLMEGKVVQGGSTITQQLVKNTFLSPERTITRKIKELVLSVELESKYSKDEIFSFYLNQVPYGSNAYGIEAASQTYFGKSVRDVALEEAAVLAGILKATTYYSPWGNHVKDLLDRKDYILERMYSLGFISEKEKTQAQEKEIVFSPPSIGSIEAPHFSLLVKDYLVNKYGEDMVLNGGLKVITTLDSKLQNMAEKSVFEGSKNNENLYGSKNAALVAQDPKSGQILALVGSRDYFDTENEGNFNVATQGLRQPGSALKPFVYLTAFQKGYLPDTVIFDVSTEFDLRDDPEYSYRPQNFDGKTRGPVKLRNALAESLNIPAVKLLYLTGINESLKTLHNFGISTLNETWRYGLSLVLGGGEVKLIDLVGAYATLSQEGIKHNQVIILRIEDSKGNILEEYHDKTERAAEEEEIRVLNNILSSPELRYPIFGSSISYTTLPGYEVALKTGTSQDHRDAWTIGYTPFLTVGVWAGNNDNTPMIRQGSSILAAVPIWGDFFKKTIEEKKYEPETFKRPESISFSSKPMLGGEYIWKPVVDGSMRPQIHSILFYVNKDDPVGNAPENPKNDPQYENWESGVRNWAAIHIPGFSSYNLSVPFSSIKEIGVGVVEVYSGENNPSGTPVEKRGLSISDTSVKNGDFVSSPFSITARINSGSPIKFVELYHNRRLIHRIEPRENYYYYNYKFDGRIDPQNFFEIKTENNGGENTSQSFILYSK